MTAYEKALGYYHALEQYDATEELSGFVAFLRQQTTKMRKRVAERDNPTKTRKKLDESIR